MYCQCRKEDMIWRGAYSNIDKDVEQIIQRLGKKRQIDEEKLEI